MKYCFSCMNTINGDESVCPVCGASIETTVPAHHLKAGTVIGGKFVVGKAIGEGGFGITYIGIDIKLDIKVAIKEYYPNGYVNRNNNATQNIESADHTFFDRGKERFLREARILAKMSGEQGIVGVRDFFEENNTAYIVMEYLEGEDLKTYLKRQGTMNPQQAIEMLMPLMRALTKIHDHGLIHRDISPDNIRLTENGVKLIDFGAAQDVSTLESKSFSVMLKPGYAPEEQYRSRGEQGPWTDVYALCATIYKCITGITPDDSAQRGFSDELKAPSALGVEISPTVEAALMKGLSVHKNGRYLTVGELIDGFNGINTNDDDEKTLYVGNAVPEDDIPTRYIRKEPVKQAPVVEPQPAPQIQPQAPKKQAPPVKKPKRKGKLLKALGVSAVALVLAVVGIIALFSTFKTLDTVTICGEPIDKSTDRIYLSDKTITVKDAENIVGLGKLEDLIITSSAFENGAFDKLSGVVAPVTELRIIACTGIESFSAVSEFKFLQMLTLRECGLTDKLFNEITLSNKDYLTYVNICDNEKLSDLSKLDEINDTLSQLDVSGTAVTDFSPLKDCKILTRVEAKGNGLKSIDSLQNESITVLDVTDNQLTNLDVAQNYKYLYHLYASNNIISDISGLADRTALYNLELNNNQITDISVLSGCTRLGVVYLDGNAITSLAPLADCSGIKYFHANNNKLTNLDGLEKAIELKVLDVSQNQLENINGIKNCTILERVNLNRNKISDISLLSKSSETLTYLYFNYNNVSDISALKGTALLKHLSFDYNNVEDISALSQSVSLNIISADSNKIKSIEGLSNSLLLKYICLPHNEISSMEPLKNLIPRAENDFGAVDLSSNKITKLCLASGKCFTYLALYNNPIESYDDIKNADGTYCLFSYKDGIDFTDFKPAFNFYTLIDCPLDKQVSVEKGIYGTTDYISINSGVNFLTVEEADKQMRDVRDSVLPESFRTYEDGEE